MSINYTPPAGDEAGASWLGSGAYTAPAGDQAGASWITIATGADSSPLRPPSLRVVQANPAHLAAPSPLLTPAARTLNVQVASPLAVPALRVTVHRYILAGNVISGGAPVERLVRAYRRDTGALIGSANTIGGAFVINAGFAENEHYLLPIDTDEFATDFTPPAVNRVVSVLAQD
jgi:hypothetical protein